MKKSIERDRQFAPRLWSALLLGVVLLLAAAPGVAWAEEGGKSGVKPNVISLPSGPGSIEGLGEVFEPDLSTGTASYPFPFAVAPARVGFAPSLALTYNGGNANGPWGLGWALSVPSIQRRTDAGLPVYDDDADGFVHSNGEKLVRLANGDYRFENEGDFQRFRRLAGGGWEAHMPDGTRLLFGESDAARERNDHGVFRWRLERQIDTHGNEIRFLYEQDGGYAYLVEVRYNFTQDGRYNAVLFHYEARPDVFSDRRSGAPITVRRRSTDIQVLALGEPVRSYRFDYAAESATGVHSLLASITTIGADGVSELPPHRFTYTQFDPAAHETVYMQTPPALPLLDPDAELVDINADGLPDVVHTPAQGHRFFLNRGNGRWQSQAVLPAQTPPDRLSSSSTRMADMDGNGVVDLLVKAGTTPGAPFYYYTRGTSGQWELGERLIYGSSPGFALNAPNVGMIDVNNDKRIDVMVTTGTQAFIWLAQEHAWSPTADFIVPLPSLGGPVSLDNPRVHLGDMTGDRLQDLIFVQDGQVVYWPHNGNGDYAAPVFMQNPPRGLGNLDTTLLVGDLNNDGLDDLVLPYNRSVRYWLNRGDGSYADPVTLHNTPGYNHMNVTVRLADMDGDGAQELLFSKFPAPALEIMQYVDFSTGAQPFLLKSIDNGLGRRIEIEHRPSTDFYVEDAENGEPWQTKLPFPVQVVSRVTVHDANSGDSYVTDYRYRDGYYDGAAKEFRGFARAEMVEHGDETAPTTVTRFVYDTGAEDESRKGIVVESEILGDGGVCAGIHDGCYRREVNDVTTRTLHEAEDGRAIAYSFVTQTDTYIHEEEAEPVHLRQVFDRDDFGNLTRSFNYGQVCAGDVTCGNDELLETMEYAYNEEAWILNRSSRVVRTGAGGNIVAEERRYYDGEDYVGLPLGQVVRGDLARQEESLGPLGENRFIPTQRQAFDQYGNVVGMMNANGHTVSVVFDAASHTFPVLERLDLATGRALTVTAAYDPRFGKITAATDYNGNASTFAYDSFGRIEQIVRPGDTAAQPTQRFSYAMGSPRSAITTEQRERSGSEDALVSVSYFDGLGRKLQTRTEAENGQVVVTEAGDFNARQSPHNGFLPYFDDGFDYRMPDPDLAHTTQHYDPLGRKVRTVNADGTFTHVEHRPLVQVHYDEEDNHPGSPHADTPKILTYDGLARLISVEEINTIGGQIERYTTRYGYDPLGNLTRVVDAQGNLKTMVYDALSRKVRMDDPVRGEMIYAYDDAGNLIRTEDARGQIVHYTYDAANRLLSERWEVAGQAEIYNAIYHYDGDVSSLHPDARNTLGRVAFIEDQVGTVHYTYDARGNVAGMIRRFAAEDVVLVTRMDYDAMDRLSTLTYPDGATVTYEYDARGLLARIPGFVDAVNYMASGQRDQVRYANGVESRYRYDQRLRLEHLQTMAGEIALQDLIYSFDNVGNVASIADGRPQRTRENDGSQCFGYDSLYRLTNATGSYGQIDYGYDAIGNLVRKTSTAADDRLNLGSLRYGENDAGPYALTSAGGERYAYDSTGNLAQKGQTLYTWDPRNRLLAVETDTTETTYAYDSDGQRVRQNVRRGETITTTLYAGQYVEVRGDDLVLYVFDDETRVAQMTKAFNPGQLLKGFHDSVSPGKTTVETRWYVTDHLGGTSLLVDAAGQVVSEIAYYPYGLVRYEQNGTQVRYGFAGKELDTNGLQYVEARYYDALTGRFLSVDPLYVEEPQQGQANPQRLNLYAYTLNNPVRYVDPDGASPENKVYVVDTSGQHARLYMITAKVQDMSAMLPQDFQKGIQVMGHAYEIVKQEDGRFTTVRVGTVDLTFRAFAPQNRQATGKRWDAAGKPGKLRSTGLFIGNMGVVTHRISGGTIRKMQTFALQGQYELSTPSGQPITLGSVEKPVTFFFHKQVDEVKAPDDVGVSAALGVTMSGANPEQSTHIITGPALGMDHNLGPMIQKAEHPKN